MPKISEKYECLNGSVVLYGSGTSEGKWFYREWDKTSKKYRQKQITDAVTVGEAITGAIDAAFVIKQEKEGSSELASLRSGVITDSTGIYQRKTQGTLVSRNTINNKREKRETINHAIEQWIIIQNERAEKGLIEPETAQAKANVYRTHMLRYLQMKGITWCHQIDRLTFDDYELVRAEATPLQRQNELKKIKHFCSGYLAKRGLIDPLLLLDKEFLPKVKITQMDRMANPAINADDWKLIVDYVRDEWRPQVEDNYNQRYWWWRTLFWHFILFSKNTGCSPEEVIKLKWKQLEIVDEGRINSKGEKVSCEIVYVQTIRSKTMQPREIPTNQAKELRRWRAFVLDYCSKHNLPMPGKDTYVFGNPLPFGDRSGWRQYARASFYRSWREILDSLRGKLSGHRFSQHQYTLYSMRATFIEDHLLKGTPVMEVAEMAGHSVVETQKSYARLNLRLKGQQIASPTYGKKKPQVKETEQLF